MWPVAGAEADSSLAASGANDGRAREQVASELSRSHDLISSAFSDLPVWVCAVQSLAAETLMKTKRQISFNEDQDLIFPVTLKSGES